MCLLRRQIKASKMYIILSSPSQSWFIRAPPGADTRMWHQGSISKLAYGKIHLRYPGVIKVRISFGALHFSRINSERAIWRFISPLCIIKTSGHARAVYVLFCVCVQRAGYLMLKICSLSYVFVGSVFVHKTGRAEARRFYLWMRLRKLNNITTAARAHKKCCKISFRVWKRVHANLLM